MRQPISANVYCKNCNASLQGKYCHNCGQKNIDLSRRNLKHLFEEFFHYFTHLDSKVFKTLKTLLTRPGQITTDIIHGITVRYFKLSSLFLIATLIYFLLKGNYFGFMNTPFNSQINAGIGAAYKSYLAEQKIIQLQTTKEAIATVYNAKLQNYGKLVTLFLIPLTIPALWLLNMFVKMFKKNHHFKAYDLGMASLEINTILVIVMFVLGGTANEIIYWLLGNSVLSTIITGLIFLYILTLLLLFIKRVFEINWWLSTICLLLFLALYGLVIDLFRFISFVILL